MSNNIVKKKSIWNKPDLYVGLVLFGFFVYIFYPKFVPSSQDVVDNNPKKPQNTPADISRTPERDVKFIKPEQIKIKPQENQTPTEKLTAKNNKPTVSEELLAEQAELLENGYGTIPPVDTKNNLNPQKQSVIKALESGETTNLSIAGKRELFDKDKYKQDPDGYIKEYLSTFVASRCYEAAQPGEGVPHLKRVSPQFIETYQNEQVEIVVEGCESGAPASIATMDGGAFINDLSGMTVQADASGRAVFLFLPGEGVINDCRIVVGSPLSSGLVNFNVNVKKKRELVNE